MCVYLATGNTVRHVKEAHAQGIITASTCAHTSTQRDNKVLCSALTLMYQNNYANIIIKYKDF